MMSIAARWLHHTFNEMTSQPDDRLWSRLLKRLLFPASLVYGFSVKFRNLLYDRSIFHSIGTEGLVVSVGNIEVGGTGKTPFVIALCHQLQQFAKVGVVSRGYGSLTAKRQDPIVIEGDKLSAMECGDEPLLIARHLPGAIVIVGKDRIKGVKLAQKKGADLVVLDDGMQHRRLKRDIEIVLVTRRIHNGQFLPAGVLRDDPKRLETADFVFRADGVDFCLQPTGIFSIKEGKPISIEGKRVALLCGIARPMRFYESVKALGAHIEEVCFYPDHFEFSSSNLSKITKKFKKKGIEIVLCTEKDGVKLETYETHLPVAVLKIELRSTNNNDAWSALINKIKEKL
ncbi:MAG: tetraacyldisaccharide 4'-kinase [Chlamydiia bacterium]|nr:tetraacyldisaccharide 4'-kinase [Chlamydiia bacterium]